MNTIKSDLASKLLQTYIELYRDLQIVNEETVNAWNLGKNYDLGLLTQRGVELTKEIQSVIFYFNKHSARA